MKRRIVALGLAAALAILAAACGEGSPTEEASAGEASPPPVTRVVKHALGKTEIPTDPQRIVVLNPYSILDYLIALDIVPVGSTGGEGLDDYPFGYWLEGRTDGVEMVGGTIEPDLEQLAAVEPDLILSNPWQEDIHKELSQIAPTVAVPLSYSDYEEEFRYVADVVGRLDEAEAVIAAHHERLEAFKAAAGHRLDQEMSVIRVFPDSIRIEVGSYVTTLLDAAGIQRPPAQKSLKESADVSIEQARLIDGDVILIYSADSGAERDRNDKAVQKFLDHPLLGNLDAAREGRVHEVDSRVWAGGGILWADAILDDLSPLLVGGS
jgi:iron complex transport system substrate-binding protein